MVRIIAIMGAAGAGKTTVAQLVVANSKVTVFRSFAEPLKRMLGCIGLTREELYGADKEKPCTLLSGKTPRHAMQTLGTEWRDTIDKRLWSNILEQDLLHLKRNHLATEKTVVLIDDCRFPHEVEMLRGLGAEIWVVRRQSVERAEFWMTLSRSSIGRAILFMSGLKRMHPSETYWPLVESPVEIDNNSSLAKLKSQVDFHLRGEPDH